MRCKGKKGIAVFVAAAMLAGTVTNGMPIWEPVVAQAESITYMPLNQEFDESDTVYFELTECGVVTFLNGSNLATGSLYRVLDNGNEERYAGCIAKQSIRLAPGKYTYSSSYYVGSYGGYGGSSITMIKFVPESNTVSEQEWNDSLDTANEINTNVAYKGNLNMTERGGESSDRDYYHFSLPTAGEVQLQYSLEDLSTGDYGGYNENIITLYSEDKEGNTKALCDVLGRNTSNKTRYSKQYRLPEGSYFICVHGWEGIRIYADVTDYQIKVNYTSEAATDHEQEYNDTIATANSIETNTGYTGNVPTKADKDYYKFTLSATSRVKLKMQVPRQSTNELFTATLYKEDGTAKLAAVKTTSNPVARSTEQLLEPGTYYVLVESDKEEDSEDYTLTVEANEVVTVNSIQLSPDKTPVYVGDSVKMTATVLPENAENKEVEWETSDSTVATIDASGTVTCVGAGNVYITAKAKDGSNVTAQYLLNVQKILVEGIMVSAPSDTATVGEQVQLSAVIKPDNAMDKTVIWDSSNEEIATVSEEGKVTCKAAGDVTITATAEDEGRIAGSITLHIKDKELEATATPEPTVTPKETPAVTGKETPAPTSVVTPQKTPESTPQGTTVPTPTKPVSIPSIKPEPTIAVSPDVEPTETPDAKETSDPTDSEFEEDWIQEMVLGTDLSEDEKIYAGSTFEVYVNIYPEELSDSEVCWTSSNEKVATVSENGRVKCKAAGTVTITATATDGSGVSVSETFKILKAKSAVCTLSKIAYSQGKLTPKFNKNKTSYTLTLTQNMSSVIMKPTASDKAATITVNGKKVSKIKVTLKKGKSKKISIVVKAENGKKKTYKITVKRKR